MAICNHYIPSEFYSSSAVTKFTDILFEPLNVFVFDIW